MRHRSTIAIVTGALLIALALAWSLNAWVFTTNSHRVGSALLRQAAARTAQASHSGTNCVDPATTGVTGTLTAPSIGLIAPVEQGLSDPVLAVAVGHDPSSVWPGTPGTAVLSAHDVSYFVNAAQLSAGSTLRYETPCVTYSFSVTGHKVVHEGSPVYNTRGPSIVLVTCWPTNALWFTPDRLVVTAIETAATRTVTTNDSHAKNVAAVSYTPPLVHAPAVLVNQGLTLATNSIPMGTMTIAGTPSKAWTQSPDPLDVEQSAVEAYIGGLKAIETNHLSWWSSIAPRVVAPKPLLGAHAITYKGALDVTITVSDSNPKMVTLSTSVGISGGAAPGNYSMNVREVLRRGSLYVAKWDLSPI